MANGRIVSNSGRIINPQNLPRPTLANKEIEFGIETLKADCADFFHDNVMEIASNAIRGVIVAPPGKKLLVADLSNIEGRYAAWLADEQWKLKAFRDFDTIIGVDTKGKSIRKGHDLYILDYARSFNVSPENVTKKQRDEIGKTLALSMQFGGGVGAFVTFATNFGVDLALLVKEARPAIPPMIWEEAKAYWDYCVLEKIKDPSKDRTLGLEEDVFITCDSLKRLWRLANPGIQSMWDALGEAAVNAIESPGKLFTAGNLLQVRRDGNWLRIIQPSGRSLCYPAPKLNNEDKISFMGMDQYSRKWSRIETYGSKLFENAVQGGARDIFMHGVVHVEKGEYPIVMRIHDEIIAEVPDTEEYNVKELCRSMTTGIEWAKGLPLAAGGFSAYRYKKAE